MHAMLITARSVLARLGRPDSGQDLIEYGLLVALIAIVVLAAVAQLGNTINTIFWTPIAQSF